MEQKFPPKELKAEELEAAGEDPRTYTPAKIAAIYRLIQQELGSRTINENTKHL